MTEDICPACGFNKVIAISSIVSKCKNCGIIYLKEIKYIPTRKYTPAQKEDIYKKSKLKIFKFILNKLDEYDEKKGKLLDIGCSYGHFMELAVKNGWDAEGVELLPDMLSELRKKNYQIYDKPVEELNLNHNFYAAVSVLEVLCLTVSLQEMVDEIYKILKPNGILIMREFNSVFHFNVCDIFKKVKIFNIRPMIFHNFNFNAKSLCFILKKAGFKDVKIINSIMSDGDSYGTGGKLGSSFVSVFKTMYYIFSQIVYYLSFGKIYIGSSLIVVARKP